MSTHHSLIRVHVAAIEVGHAATPDVEPAARATLCAKGEHTKRSSGALEERSGKGQKASTYLSYIVEDIAAVEVRGATGPHEEPAARLHAESEHTKRSSGALE